MKKYQFEEITCQLSLIVTLLAWHFEVYWLAVFWGIKFVFDFYCAFKYAKEEAERELKQQIQKDEKIDSE